MIDKATSQLAEIKDQLEEDEGTEVKRIGITFNDDGTMSMFAELEQISERRREAIAKEREARKAEAEEAEKAAEKKADEKEKLEEIQAGGLEEAHGKKEGRNLWDGILPPDDKVKRTVVTANTVEDLISQIKGVNWDDIEAVDNKPPVGGKFDFTL